MRVDLHVAYIIYCLFKFLQAAIDDKIIAECFYLDELQDFFFPVNIAGISQNVSCTDNCSCKGTNIGYHSLNCQSCCCQRRVIYRETNHDCNGWIAWGSTVTVLLVLVTLSLWVRNRLDKKRSKKKIKERDDKLTEKESELEQLKIAENHLSGHPDNQDQRGG